jgi:hypothetical protein
MLNVDMLNIIMLNIIMLNVIMLNVVMVNVVMLNAVMLNVLAPIKDCHLKARFRRLHFLDLLVDSGNLFLDPVVQLQLERDNLSAVSYTLFLQMSIIAAVTAVTAATDDSCHSCDHRSSESNCNH